MLIAAFAKRAGVSIDTARFYVRRRLLRPSIGTRGGRNPYQVFSEADLDAAAVIRTCQALGLSLHEISAFLEEYRDGRLSDEALIEFLRQQQRHLHEKAAELALLTQFLTSKIKWIENGKTGAMPSVGNFQ